MAAPIALPHKKRIEMTMTRSLSSIATAALIGAAASISGASAFVAPAGSAIFARTSSPTSLFMAEDQTFDLMVTLPGRGELSAQMRVKSVLDVPSELVEVRYKVPFGLNVEPKNNYAMCTKDGPGGEREGDVLRFTSQWTLGLPRGDGVITTAMSFSGGISWQCSMFDVMRAGRWEEVVAALTSNVEQRTDEVVLLFERPLPEKAGE